MSSSQCCPDADGLRKGVACEVEQDGDTVKIILSCDDPKKFETIRKMVIQCKDLCCEKAEKED